jgi:sodium-dependent dicarboxylate transporter 2/3/5
VSNVIPLAVTSLLAIALLPLVGAVTPSEAFSFFGNTAVFFILGVFILAAAMTESGLSTRLALFFLSRFDRGPRTLLAGIMGTSFFLSFWMPEHAVAAMMFPLVLEIARSLKIVPGKSTYGRALFLCLAWGAVTGGVATLLGGARNPLALGLLAEHYPGMTVGFFRWIVLVAPMAACMAVITFIVIGIAFPIDVKDIAPARKVIKARVEKLGPMRRRERWLSYLLIATVLAWIFLGERVGLALIAILSAVFLFLLRLVRWEEIERNVNWGVILMYGGAIALAGGLERTGAVAWLVDIMMPNAAMNSFILIAVIGLGAKFLTEGISNAAVVALMLPAAFAIGDAAGLNPLLMVLTVAVPSGLAYCLPMGTPPNAIAYSSGYYRIRDCARVGLWCNFISWVLLLVFARYYWPNVGLTW